MKPLGSYFSELPLSGDAEICALHLHFSAMFCRVICFDIIACDILHMMVNEDSSQWCIPFSARNKMPVGISSVATLRARFLCFIFSSVLLITPKYKMFPVLFLTPNHTQVCAPNSMPRELVDDNDDGDDDGEDDEDGDEELDGGGEIKRSVIRKKGLHAVAEAACSLGGMVAEPLTW